MFFHWITHIQTVVEVKTFIQLYSSVVQYSVSLTRFWKHELFSQISQNLQVRDIVELSTL